MKSDNLEPVWPKADAPKGSVTKDGSLLWCKIGHITYLPKGSGKTMGDEVASLITAVKNPIPKKIGHVRYSCGFCKAKFRSQKQRTKHTKVCPK